jgi:hypothetical protein
LSSLVFRVLTPALVSLAYGEAGLVTLFTLISVHALVLLTLATVVRVLVGVTLTQVPVGVQLQGARRSRSQPVPLALASCRL